MKNFPLVTFLIAILIILVVSCKMESSIPNNTNQRPNLLVGAASNLEYIFTDMGIDFEKQTGDKVIFAFGSSGNLARQLEHGAKFDLYASADPSYVEYLENLGLVIPEGSSIFAQGLLVAITFLGNEPHTSWEELALSDNVRFIAVANPSSAPYGYQSLSMLQGSSIWQHIQEKIIITESAAQVVHLVSSRNADLGFTAQSLVQKNKPESIFIVPISSCSYSSLPQTISLISTSKNTEYAADFLQFAKNWSSPFKLIEYGYSPNGNSSLRKECTS